MSYLIKTEESVATGVKRIATEQTTRAAMALQASEPTNAEIYAARKHLKKLRALLRLVRDEVGENIYSRQNIFYRDISRELAGVRDITSLLETIEMLKEQFKDFVKIETFAPPQHLLEEERTALVTQQVKEGNYLGRVATALEQSVGEIKELPIEPNPWDDIISSMKKVYEHGFQWFNENQHQPTPESMHEWRKGVKYLWYHYRLLSKAWSPVLKSYRQELKTLSVLLGDYHDLALLKDKLATMQNLLSIETVQVIDALAIKQQEVLLQKCYAMGERIYAEKPKAFEQRWLGYLNAWRKERMEEKKEIQLKIAS